MTELYEFENRLKKHGETVRNHIGSPVSVEFPKINGYPILNRMKSGRNRRASRLAIVVAVVILFVSLTITALAAGILQDYFVKITQALGLSGNTKLQQEVVQEIDDGASCSYYNNITHSPETAESIGFRAKPIAAVSSENIIYLYFTLEDISGDEVSRLSDTYTYYDEGGTPYMYFHCMELIPHYDVKEDGVISGGGSMDVVALEYDADTKTALMRAMYGSSGVGNATAIAANIGIYNEPGGYQGSIIMEYPVSKTETKEISLNIEAKTGKFDKLQITPMGISISGTVPGIAYSGAKDNDKIDSIHKLGIEAQKELDDLISGAVFRFKDGTELKNLDSLSGLYTGAFQIQGEKVLRTWYFKRAVDIDQLESVEIGGAAYPLN